MPNAISQVSLLDLNLDLYWGLDLDLHTITSVFGLSANHTSLFVSQSICISKKQAFCELNPILKSNPNQTSKSTGRSSATATARSATPQASAPVGFAFGFGSDFKIGF